MNSRFRFMWVVPAAMAMASVAFPASPLPVSVPSTELAARSREVIDRAVRALIALEGQSRISRLWIFPTGQADTVFVHYRTVEDTEAPESGSAVERLVMLELDGERIAKMQDLTAAPASVVAVVSAE